MWKRAVLCVTCLWTITWGMDSFGANRTGDADLDGSVIMADATLVQDRIQGQILPASISPLALADSDGDIDLVDLLLIAQAAAGSRVIDNPTISINLAPPGPVNVPSESPPFPENYSVSSPYTGVAERVDGMEVDFRIEPAGTLSTLGGASATVSAGAAQATVTPLAPPGGESFDVVLSIPMADSSGGAPWELTANGPVSVSGAVCGDSVVQAGELCDDGNLIAGDGCDASCIPEPGCGWVLSPNPYVDISGTGIDTGVTGDDAVGSVAIGFDFSFYGIPYNTLYFNTNGLVNFNGPTPTTLLQVIPSAGGVDNYIAVFCGDLLVTSGVGHILHQTTGAPGSRVFTLQWDHVARFGFGGDNNFQLLLYEGTNQVEIRFGAMTESGTSFAVGHENQAGDFGQQYSYRTAFMTPGLSLLTVPDACLTPDCGSGVLEIGEICDDGANGDPCDGCTDLCGTTAGLCGNGAVECAETCDDGNAVLGDGCTPACVSECVPSTYFREDFSDGDDAGWTHNVDFGIDLWHVSSASNAPGGNPPNNVLWYANEAQGNYDFGVSMLVQAIGPTISLPNLYPGESLVLRHWETYTVANNFDWCSVVVRELPSTYHSISDRQGNSGGWQLRSSDISYLSGKDIQPYFSFNSDSTDNAYPGWMVDEVSVEYCRQCGNLIVEPWEECDDGANGDPCDGCTDDCVLTTSLCGNGVSECAESCDDGAVGGDCDGCADSCLLTSELCGNQVVECAEDCDDGAANGTGEGFCLGDCSSVQTCGDGATNGTEGCDDGAANGAGEGFCLADCSSVQICGDGSANGTEGCDEGPANGTGNGFCLGDCSATQFCGDGATNGTEGCDDGNMTSEGDGFCAGDCSGIQNCGDGTTNGTEICDDAASNGTGEGFCVADCSAVQICGDGTTNGTEGCDDGNTVSEGEGFCVGDCSAVQNCGDGSANGTEACDDGANPDPCDGCTDLCGTTADLCGNGSLDCAETCDDGGSNGLGEGFCVADCAAIQNCGDGTTNGTEACDDGANGDPCDGCTDLCGTTAGLCGNGAVECAETCDDGNAEWWDGCGTFCNSTCRMRLWYMDDFSDGDDSDWLHIPFAGTDLWHVSSSDNSPGGGTPDNTMWFADEAQANYVTFQPELVQLRSPNIPLPTLSSGEWMRYSYWEKYDLYFPFDTGRSGYFTPSLSSYQTDVIYGSSGGWVQKSSNIYNFNYPSILFYFEFSSPDANIAYAGWKVDDIQLEVCIHCGNGNLDAGEICDDGVANGTGDGFCLDDCSDTQLCGDGVAEGTEACDDGAANGAGEGFCVSDCSGVQTCGDGVVNGAEGCDDGAANGAGNGFCLADCSVVQICGDGVVNGAEGCDDSNTVSEGEGSCAGDCSGIQICGDGATNGTEMCDDGNLLGGDGCEPNCQTGCAITALFEDTFSDGDDHGWTHYPWVGTDLWHVSAADNAPGGALPPNVLWLVDEGPGNYDTGATLIAQMRSQSIQLPTLLAGESLTYSYWESYDTEPAVDQCYAGIFDPLFVDYIVHLGNGNSGGWSQQNYDLAPLAGQAIQPYFEFQADGVNDAYPGWKVDEVRIEGCLFCGNGYMDAGEDCDDGPLQASELGTLGISGWGRSVALSGGFAFVCDTNFGLRVVDISNPASPAEVGSLSTSGSCWDLATNGTLVYIADGANGMLVVDVSNPMAPNLLSTVPTTQANGVVAKGDLAFVADVAGGLRIIEVGNPLAPVILGSLPLGGVTRSVAVEGTTAYLADDAAGLRVVDVSNPVLPVLLGTVLTPPGAMDVAVKGSSAYVASWNSGMSIVDVVNPAAPDLVGLYETSGVGLSVVVSGNRAYLANLGSLEVIDIADPIRPVGVGRAALSPSNVYGIAVSGQRAYLGTNDGETLRVFDVAEPCLPACGDNTCGDGVVSDTEECDGNARNFPCEAGACLFANCGNNIVEAGETCDQGFANSDAIPNACRSNCTPPTCGDAVIDTGEVCDQGALNGSGAGFCLPDCSGIE